MTTSGNLLTFGDNSQGQLGHGRDVIHSHQPREVSEITEPIGQVSCGHRHTLALSRSGKVYGMGSNRTHQMGLGESSLAREACFFHPIRLSQLDIHRITKVAAGGFSAAITDQRQLILWGTGTFGTFSTPQKVCMEDVNFIDIQVSCED